MGFQQGTITVVTTDVDVYMDIDITTSSIRLPTRYWHIVGIPFLLLQKTEGQAKSLADGEDAQTGS